MLGRDAGASLRVLSRTGRMKRLGEGRDVDRSRCVVGRQHIVNGEAIEGDRLTVDDEHGAGLGLRPQLTGIRRAAVCRRRRRRRPSSLPIIQTIHIY